MAAHRIPDDTERGQEPIEEHVDPDLLAARHADLRRLAAALAEFDDSTGSGSLE